MSDQVFYVTTPIYYVNDNPHIGHAYTTVLADVLARYHRAKGDDSFFLTGTDEHGQKVEKAAKLHGMTPIEQCDKTVVNFQSLWKKLNITNDDFIRTTQERHEKIVSAVLQDLYARDLIYQAPYTGNYCVPCERYFTDKDLVDGNLCPDCHRPTERLEEQNYFFRMSRYQEWLVEYIRTHEDFIQPAFRANETLGFLKQPLGDLCISRSKKRLSWGIELPFDHDYVCYVWFDALLNYVSAIGYGTDEARFRKYWPECRHLIGKDILTTHTVYWPCMLHAMGLDMPKSIFAHGWWLTGNVKMSKSLGNVVNPMDFADRYGVDAFRYFLMAAMTLGNDASFTEEDFISRYNSDLANDLGNLLSRVVKLTLRCFDGLVPQPELLLEPEDKSLLACAGEAVAAVTSSVENMKLDRGLETVMNVVRAGNRYMEQTAPWTLAKEGNTKRLATVLYTAAETLRIVSGLLFPVMPEKMAELRRTIGMSEEDCRSVSFEQIRSFGTLRPGSRMQDIAALFPRIQTEKPACAAAPAPEKKKEPRIKEKKTAVIPEGIVTIADLQKVHLRTARVLSAERIADADRLLSLKIDLGNGDVRPLVAGIAKFYEPEALTGKTIVVVENLLPTVIRKHESRGMLLAARDGEQLRLVTVDGECAPGSEIG